MLEGPNDVTQEIQTTAMTLNGDNTLRRNGTELGDAHRRNPPLQPQTIIDPGAHNSVKSAHFPTF